MDNHCKACHQKLDAKHNKLLKEMTGSMLRSYNDYKKSGVVLEIEWLAGDDEFVCDFCKSLHHRIFNLTDPRLKYLTKDDHKNCFNRHCRCTLLPVIKHFKVEAKMALIHCLDCNKEVSSIAPSCPHCGRPIMVTAGPRPQGSMTVGTERPIELTSKRFKLIYIISFIMVVLGVIGGIAETQGENQPGFWTALFFIGILIYGINRFRIWWHHK